MSKKANPTVIGAFIVGAIAIFTTLILLLSSNIFFQEHIKAILYFEGSVTGLNVGAPVKFRGVKIGTVKDIKLILDQESHTLYVPVLVEIDRDSFFVKTGDKYIKGSETALGTNKTFEDGFYAQLKLNSMLTGQLYIELEFDPGGKYTLRGNGGGDEEISEIPTRTTGMQEISKTLDEFPIEEVLNNITSAMASINKILSDPVILETMHSINQLAKKLDSETTTVSTDLKRTLIHAEKTLITLDNTLKTTDDLLHEDSAIMNSLQDALTEISSAARSVGALADTLEQQPEAIIRGKSAGGN